MRLSVIIPCFNAGSTIAVQLEALAQQQWSEPWEVVISNNGCTDNTLEIVEQYRDRLPNLRIVDSSDRKGAAHACNLGAMAAIGRSIVVCDADDEVSPNWVALMGNALEKYDFVAGYLDLEKLNEPWLWASRKEYQSDNGQPPPVAGCGNFGINRSLYQQVGMFDESIPALFDIDLSWRLYMEGIVLHYVPEAIVHYRYRSTMKGIYQQKLKYGKYDVYLYKKYGPSGLGLVPYEHPWKVGLRSWVHLAGSCVKLRIRTKEGLARWVGELGWRVGRLQGSLEYKIFHL